MAVRTKSRRRKRGSNALTRHRLWPLFVRYLPGWLLMATVLVILMPNLLGVTFRAAGQVAAGIPSFFSQIRSIFSGPSTLAPLFTREIDHWSSDIQRWASEYGVDANLLATVMQIESCGNPTVRSYAGAQGLFQVMPFHFDSSENQLDPDTNARRGASFLKQCYTDWAKGDVGLALACYNGGPSVTQQPYSQWSDQTKRYYRWGTGIYADALVSKPRSDTLDQWLNAGGSVLCQMAADSLGI